MVYFRDTIVSIADSSSPIPVAPGGVADPGSQPLQPQPSQAPAVSVADSQGSNRAVSRSPRRDGPRRPVVTEPVVIKVVHITTSAMIFTERMPDGSIRTRTESKKIITPCPDDPEVLAELTDNCLQCGARLRA